MNRYRADPRLLAPLLAGLSMLGPFSIDTFFPAFGRMQQDFGIGPAAMQQSISVYLASYGVMSLLHGPLSDAYGRRGPVFYGLLLYLLATLGCALAPSYPWLLACRALQGASAGAGLIVGRAVIRDRYAGADAQRLMSQVTLIFGAAPALAPIVGGWVLYFADWRWIFGVLVLFTALLTGMTLLALPETHPRARRVPFDAAHLLRAYRAVGGDLRFMLLASAAALNFNALFLYIASAPVVVPGLLHLSERQYPWLFVPTIGGMTIGAFISGRLAGKRSAGATVALGYGLIFAGAALNLLLNRFLQPAVPWFVLPIGLGGIGIALAFPTLTLLMLDRFPAARGAAASVQMAVSIVISTPVAGLLSPLVSHSGMKLALTGLGLSASGLLCWLLYRRITPQLAPEVLLPQPVMDMPDAPAIER